MTRMLPDEDKYVRDCYDTIRGDIETAQSMQDHDDWLETMEGIVKRFQLIRETQELFAQEQHLWRMEQREVKLRLSEPQTRFFPKEVKS